VVTEAELKSMIKAHTGSNLVKVGDRIDLRLGDVDRIVSLEGYVVEKTNDKIFIRTTGSNEVKEYTLAEFYRMQSEGRVIIKFEQVAVLDAEIMQDFGNMLPSDIHKCPLG
jgi:hypothetical protein